MMELKIKWDTIDPTDASDGDQASLMKFMQLLLIQGSDDGED